MFGLNSLQSFGTDFGSSSKTLTEDSILFADITHSSMYQCYGKLSEAKIQRVLWDIHIDHHLSRRSRPYPHPEIGKTEKKQSSIFKRTSLLTTAGFPVLVHNFSDTPVDKDIP